MHSPVFINSQVFRNLAPGCSNPLTRVGFSLNNAARSQDPGVAVSVGRKVALGGSGVGVGGSGVKVGSGVRRIGNVVAVGRANLVNWATAVLPADRVNSAAMVCAAWVWTLLSIGNSSGVDETGTQPAARTEIAKVR